MSKIKEYISNKISEIDPASAIIIANGGINIGLIFLTGLLSSSENTLTEKKLFLEQNPVTPLSGEACTYYFDMGCYQKVEIELCDGQNTVLNFEDDVCENISYWQYSPTFGESIK